MITTNPILEQAGFYSASKVFAVLREAELSTGIILEYEEVLNILKRCRQKGYSFLSPEYRQCLVDEYKATVFSKACDLTCRTEA